MLGEGVEQIIFVVTPAAVLHAIQFLPSIAYRLALALAGHSVLVAAHTSAGKTVIAQYCCAMGLRCGRKLAV